MEKQNKIFPNVFGNISNGFKFLYKPNFYMHFNKWLKKKL